MKNVYKSLRFLLMTGIMAFGFAGTGTAHSDYVEIDVWADHGFDVPYCAYDEFDLYLRPEKNCFVTVMVIDPHGYANIIYPVNNYHQRRLLRGRVYRLSDLLADPFYFYDIDGRAYISVVATRRPVFLNPWLLNEVRIFSDEPYRMTTFGMEISFGNIGIGGGFSLHWTKHIRSYGYGVFTTSIVLNHAHHHEHQRFYKRRYFTRRDWAKRWAYRSHEPVIIYKSKKPDKTYVKKRQFEIRKSNSSRRVVNSQYESHKLRQKVRKKEGRRPDIHIEKRGKRTSAIPLKKEISRKVTNKDEKSKSRKPSRRVKKKPSYRK